MSTIMKIVFIENPQEKVHYGGVKISEAEMPGQEQEYCRFFLFFLSKISNIKHDHQ